MSNLNYIAFPSAVDADLSVFREVVAFERVAMLFDRFTLEAIPGLRAYYQQAVDDAGLTATFVTGRTAQEVLDGLNDDEQALFVALPTHLPPAELAALTAGLIERRLPSFSAVGTRQVQAGMLVGLHTGNDLGKLARRVALNIQSVLLGDDAGQLPVFFSRSERLTVNMATARAIDVYPSWAVMTEAEVIDDVEKPVARTIDLISAVQEAVRANLDLAVSSSAIAAGEQRVREARARLLPQLDVAATGAVVDDGLAGPFQAERTVSGSATVSQLLYADGARTGHAIERSLQEARLAEREQLRLDIVRETSTTYLNLLRARTFERVQKENLELTRKNLELARVRRQIGVSGPSEVYRWESQIATARNGVIQANATRNVAEMALNRLLHRPLEESFAAAETGLYDERLITHDQRFIRFIDNKKNFAIFRDFMVENGHQCAPELRGLDAAIAASEHALTTAQRAFYVPTLGLQGDASRHFSRAGKGSQFEAVGGDASWTVGVNASYPLYSGGARFAAKQKAAAELTQLQTQRKAVAERIEQRIRSALHIAGATYAGIGMKTPLWRRTRISSWSKMPTPAAWSPFST